MLILDIKNPFTFGEIYADMINCLIGSRQSKPLCSLVCNATDTNCPNTNRPRDESS